VDIASGRLAELAAELARQQEYEESVLRARSTETQAKLRMNQLARAASEARLALQDLENKESARQKLAKRVASDQKIHQQTSDELAQAQAELAQLQALVDSKDEIARQHEAWLQARAEVDQWNNILAQLHPLKAEESELREKIQQTQAELETELALKERQWQEAQAAAAELPALSQQVAELQKEVAALAELEEKDREQRARLAALQVEIEQVGKELAELEQRLQVIPARQAQRDELKAQVESLLALAEEEQTRQQRLSELRVLVRQTDQEIEQLQERLTELARRREFMLSGETDVCPVCQRPLGEDGREHVLQEYDREMSDLQAQIEEIQARRAELVAEGKRLKEASSEAELRLQRLPGLQRQLAQLESFLQGEDGDLTRLQKREQELRERQEQLQAERETLRSQQESAIPLLRDLPGKRQALGRMESQLARLQELAAPLDALQEQVSALRQRLAAGVLPELQPRLAEISARLAELRYDEAAHRQAQQELASLAQAAEQWRQVQSAEARLPQVAARVQRLQERWQNEAANLQDDEAELAALAQAVQDLPQVQKRWQEADEMAARAHQEWEMAHGELAAAKQKLAALSGIRQQRDQVEKELAQLKTQVQRYHTLEKAFGRDGVQAMIIEAALPELETEANRLLARLSDGRMNVRLQTQREKKTGGVKEALDIIISDDLGSRPYELYSGGEAFRVDLALRIALSRLLAHRAGAALQTLFIDEGFGSQDTRGRENLVEAINMIKDEFALILVITHIDELKDQFPVRILVEKTERGSTYRLG